MREAAACENTTNDPICARSELTSAPLFLTVEKNITKVMTKGVATFSGLSLDRSGRNLKLRFSLYGYDRLTGNWNETGVHLDTDFFHVAEGMPASLNLEQVLSGNYSYDERPMYPHVVRVVLLSYRLKTTSLTASTIGPKR